MALHFTPAELGDRRAAVCADLAERGLAGLLCFRQESMYWLTGYDTFGYVFFQCLVLTADGRMALLTRAPDLRQARHTSVIEDVRIWVDRDGAGPADELLSVIRDLHLTGERLGVEWEAYGLTAANGRRLAAAFEGVCPLVEASDLVSRRRAVKSPTEIAYVRRAAQLVDDALDAALAAARPGAFEGDILADLQAAIYRGGGDDPANEQIIGSGPDALLCRYHSGRRHLGDPDQLTLEIAAAWRHYHACLMRTVPIGRADPRHVALHAAAVDAMLAVEDALKPGRPVGEAFAAYARICDAAGLQPHRLNACGYSLGTTFAPNWMDWPMLYADNPVLVEPGMVFFAHMILMDSDAGIAMCPGHTVLIGPDGPERLSRHPLDLVVR